MLTRVVALAVVALASSGCRKKPAPSRVSSVPTVPTSASVAPLPTKPAPARTWETHYKLKVEGIKEHSSFFVGAGSVSASDPWQLRAYLNFPAGTKVTLGAQSTTIDRAGTAWAPQVSILEKVANLPADRAVSNEVELDLKLNVAIPGFEAFEESLPPQPVREALVQGFGKVVDRPVTFPSDTDKPGPVDGLVVLEGRHDIRLIGNPKTVADIDLVAVAEVEKNPIREKPCTGYGKPATLQMFETVVQVYDRRTAKMLVEKRFLPSATCPSFAILKGGKISSSVPHEDIDKWARAELQRRKR